MKKYILYITAASLLYTNYGYCDSLKLKDIFKPRPTQSLKLKDIFKHRPTQNTTKKYKLKSHKGTVIRVSNNKPKANLSWLFKTPATASSNKAKYSKRLNVKLAGNSTQLAGKAERYIGKSYKPGVSAQCAAFVGHVVSSSGHKAPSNPAKCTNWLSWGKRVNLSSRRRGDIIIYSKSRYGYNHIGIYNGNGKIIHRPTRRSPVGTLNYNYRSIIGVRRLA